MIRRLFKSSSRRKPDLQFPYQTRITDNYDRNSHDLEIQIQKVKSRVSPLNFIPSVLSVLRVSITGIIRSGSLDNLERVNIVCEHTIINARVNTINLVDTKKHTITDFAEIGRKVRLDFYISFKNLSHIITSYQIIADKSFHDKNEKEFRLNIQEAFSVAGRGTVVTGKIKEGTVFIGDKLNLYKNCINRKVVTVQGLEGFGTKFNQAYTGMEVAIIMQDAFLEDFKKGDLLAQLNPIPDRKLSLY